MPRFARHTNILFAVLTVAVVLYVALSIFAHSAYAAGPGEACTQETSADGECPLNFTCHHSVCVLKCTSDATVCSAPTTCQSLSAATTVKACLYSNGSVQPSTTGTANTTCTGATPVTCRVGSSQFCTATPASCTSSSPGAQVVGGSGVTPPAATDTENDTASNSSGGGTLVNPLQASTLQELLVKVLQAVVQLGSIFLVLALVYTGFLFVMAQGAEEKISNARSALMWTVIGGVVLLGAQGIALVLQATVNAL